MNKFIYPLILGITVLHLSCKEKTEQESATEEELSAFVLGREPISSELKIPAELLPYEKAEIHTKLDAYIQRVFVDIGDRVRKGQSLVLLDAPEIKSKTAEANAKLMEIEAKYFSSEDRYKRLMNASKTEGAISEGDLILAKNSFRADSASLQAAKLMAQSFQEQQNYLTIRAPFDGIITSRMVDAGAFVNQNQNHALLTLESPLRLRLRVHVPEAFIQGVPESEKLTFSTDGITNRTFEAILARKSGSINPNTRTEIWEYEFDNSQLVLKPGMYATVVLKLSKEEESLVLPVAAVATTLERKFVIRIKDGLTEWIDVRTGVSKGGKVEVFGALEEGDILLSRASDEIKQGQQVNYRVENK
jgi:membrane fusion protein, multidrug efflux system